MNDEESHDSKENYNEKHTIIDQACIVFKLNYKSPNALHVNNMYFKIMNTVVQLITYKVEPFCDFLLTEDAVASARSVSSNFESR
jgi:hypothetical protein